jgi:hypothetical protein
MAQSFYLREQAERCRRLARDSTDPSLRDSLLKLAEDYTAKADAQEQNDETAVRQSNSDDQAVACLAFISTARSTLQKHS